MGLQANPKLGSLFDGSGGFPLAGAMCGIEPVWASEVEPYPIAVTRERLPNMKHLGDISKINGAEIEPVDAVFFGSPCQSLSVAGKQEGLKHTELGDEETTQSGMFIEAVRIIKEMRDATNGVLPRFAVWENVPGAFSSNRGEDLRIVLEELIKIVEPDAVMPPVPQKGWAYADCYIGDGWSIAYRVFDGQYWGVPQRRRRIHLVLDLGGQCAREILFKREGLRGYFETGRTPWQGTAPDAQGSLGATDREAISFEPGIAAREGGHINEGVSGTLRANAGDNRQAVAYSIENHPADSRVNIDESGKVQTLTSRMGTGGGNVPMVMEPVAYNGANITSPLNRTDPQLGDPCHTLSTDSRNWIVMPTYCLQGNGIDRADTAGCNGKGWREDICYTLNTIDRPAVAYIDTTHADDVVRIDNTVAPLQARDSKGGKLVCQSYQKVTGPLMANSHPGSYTGQDAFSDMLVAGPVGTYQNTGAGWWNESTVGATVRTPCGGDATMANVVVAGVDCRNMNETPELYPTLQAKPNGGQSLNFSGVVRQQYIVRRLTPTECARLQGFPDWWGHIAEKDDMTEEEYRFWLDVRNTHARINGKAEKEYTEAQMLTWYNKLHTDSAEYKMWGNGIALPPALYVMQGIVEALTNQKTK